MSDRSKTETQGEGRGQAFLRPRACLQWGRGLGKRGSDWLRFPPPPQNVMLDLSKRSRSGKFRLVTKFKKEKNNKNRAARCSLGAPGTSPLPFPQSPRGPGAHCCTPALPLHAAG